MPEPGGVAVTIARAFALIRPAAPRRVRQPGVSVCAVAQSPLRAADLASSRETLLRCTHATKSLCGSGTQRLRFRGGPPPGSRANDGVGQLRPARPRADGKQLP